MGTVVEGDGVVTVTGNVGTTDGCARVGEGDGAVLCCKEVLIFSEE